MTKFWCATLLFYVLLSTSVETTAAETAAGASSPPQPNLLMRTWNKVVPWSVFPATSSPPGLNVPPSAKPQPPSTSSSSEPNCACAPQTSHPLAYVMNGLANVRDALYTYADNAYHYLRPPQGIYGPEWAPSCQQFIQQDGSYGSYGKVMSASITPETHPNLFSASVASDMAQICPAFKTWTRPEDIEKKKAFWIWLAASVAQAESSCNQNVPEKRGPGGILKGVFQLAKGQEDTFPINAPASDHCSRGSSLTATGSGVCFFKMMNYYVGVHRSIFNAPRDPDRYFQSLFTNSDGNKVRTRLKLYKPCQP